MKKNEFTQTIEMNKLFDTHEPIVGNSWYIFSMVARIFSSVIVVLSGHVVNPIFCITLMIFVKGLPRDYCYGL